MPGGAKASTIPAERLAAYERAVATLPGVERKGATVPYTSVNGHMFSYLSPTGTLALRLSKADREAFIDRFHASLHEAYGIVQKEYVTVPDELLDDTRGPRAVPGRELRLRLGAQAQADDASQGRWG